MLNYLIRFESVEKKFFQRTRPRKNMFGSKYGEFSSLPWFVLLCPLTSVCFVDDAMSPGSIWPLPATGFVSTALLPTGFVSTPLHNNFSTYSAHSRCKTYKYEAPSCRTCSTVQMQKVQLQTTGFVSARLGLHPVSAFNPIDCTKQGLGLKSGIIMK